LGKRTERPPDPVHGLEHAPRGAGEGKRARQHGWAEQPIERQRARPAQDHQAEQQSPEEIFRQRLIGELNHQRQDEERNRCKPREKAEGDQRRADQLD
jgi:hypothetical protein